MLAGEDVPVYALFACTVYLCPVSQIGLVRCTSQGVAGLMQRKGRVREGVEHAACLNNFMHLCVAFPSLQ